MRALRVFSAVAISSNSIHRHDPGLLFRVSVRGKPHAMVCLKMSSHNERIHKEAGVRSAVWVKSVQAINIGHGETK